MKSQLDEGTIRHGHGEWHEVNSFLLLLLLLLLLVMSGRNEVVVDLCTWFNPWTPRKVSIKLNIKDSYLDINSICVTKYSHAPLCLYVEGRTKYWLVWKTFLYSSAVPPGKLTKLYLSLISSQFLHRRIQHPFISHCHSFCQVLALLY